MLEYEILPSSPKLTAKAAKKDKHGFPWDKLECGQSFSVPKEYMSLWTLRPTASLKGKELNKKFKVIEHETVYEVGRVA